MAIEVAEGISGSLHETTLTDFLRILAWNGRSGILLLWDGPEQVGLVLNQGRIVQALMTESVRERVETALLIEGKVTARQIEQTRALFRGARTADWRSLHLLVAEQLITERDLALAQEAAVREIMRRAMPWSSGDMQFKPNIPLLRRDGEADLSVEELLIDSLREIDEASRGLVTPGMIVRWAPTPPRGLTASVIGLERWYVLRGCDGHASVAEIAESLGREVAEVVEQTQWLLDQGAVLPVPAAPAVMTESLPESMPMEDRLIVLLSRFETSWSTVRTSRSKATAAVVKMINLSIQAYLEHWRDLVVEEARERVWQALVLADLERLVAANEAVELGITVDRPTLRDGTLITSRRSSTLQAAAERDPEPIFAGLARLFELTILRLVGEIDRPVALVDSFESVSVYLGELQQRLSDLE